METELVAIQRKTLGMLLGAVEKPWNKILTILVILSM
jgi:hypothetical protein